MKPAAGIVALAALVGCASIPDLRAVPMRGQTPELAARDGEACADKARAEAPTGLAEFFTAKAVATLAGGVLGFGAGVAAVANSNESGEAKLLIIAGSTGLGLAVGFVVGSVIGVTAAHRTRATFLEGVYRECMKERGYQLDP